MLLTNTKNFVTAILKEWHNRTVGTGGNVLVLSYQELSSLFYGDNLTKDEKISLLEFGADIFQDTLTKIEYLNQHIMFAKDLSFSVPNANGDIISVPAFNSITKTEDGYTLTINEHLVELIKGQS